MEVIVDGLGRGHSHASSLTSFPSLSPVGSPTIARHVYGSESRQVSAKKGSYPTAESPAGPSISKLTRSSPSSRALRPALFSGESAISDTYPGSLNDASNDHIERLIERRGAVELVRQLAEDLAHRDAQFSALKRRHGERERLLKRMLLDRQVSSLEIESKLKSVDSTARSASGRSDESLETLTEATSRISLDLATAEPSNRLDQMMNEAMAADVQTGRTIQSTHSHARAPSTASSQSRLTNNGSVKDLAEHRRTRATVRGWKDYLWNGTAKRTRLSSTQSKSDPDDTITPRTGSLASAKRPALSSDVFQPPRPSVESSRSTASLRANLERSGSQDLHRNTSNSQMDSSSMTAWALKLIAGGGPSNLNSGAQEPRSSTEVPDVNPLRSTSMSQSTTLTQKPGGLAPQQHQRRATTTANGGIPVDWRTAAPMPGLATFSRDHQPLSPVRSHHENELLGAGPVEMDSILPPETQPPSLNPYAAIKAGLLTDRFGFIYDARYRRRRKEVAESIKSVSSSLMPVETLQNGYKGLASEEGSGSGKTDRRSTVSSLGPETPSSPASYQTSKGTDSRNGMKWHELLRSPTYRHELLLHTPSSAAMPTLGSLKKSLQRPATITMGTESKAPTPGVLSPTTATAVISNPASTTEETVSGTSTPSTRSAAPESVKLLLDQLTELHDSLQREKTVRWNEFLRKVRAERRRDDQKTDLVDARSTSDRQAEASLMDGELIGVAGLGNRGRTGRAKWNEFKTLVLGGIPVTYRAKIYSECTGASALKIPGYYDNLVAKGPIDETIEAQIAMDIVRTLTDNIFFRQGPGVDKLKQVLGAYSQRNPEVGYCQGMNQIAACLLLIMPSAEEAFWVLTSMIENIMPAQYYDHSLLASRADQAVLRQYVSEILPTLASHFESLSIELEALTFQWFLSIFTDCLSAEALYRVWDVVLCITDGSIFLFQIALALLKLNEKQLLACETQSETYSYINHNMTNHAISIDGLISASEALKGQVRRVEVEERRMKVMEEETQRVKRQRRSVESNKAGQGLKGAKKASGESKPSDGSEFALKIEASSQEDSIGELTLQQPIPIVD